MKHLKKTLCIVSVLTIGIILGSLYERNSHSPIRSSHSSSVHYCSCIEDNPESYNSLLVEVERINSELETAIENFVANNSLRGSYIAILRITKNGDPITFDLVTDRDIDEVIYLEFKQLVGSYFSQYDQVIADVHTKHHGQNK